MSGWRDALDLLGLPFVASLLLIGVHCQFGLHVLRRNVVFVDLALAQCAALGATVAFMQGHAPAGTAAYAWSLGFAWGGALLLSLVRLAPPRIPAEALVGVLYVGAAAAALLLIEKAPQGAEHLRQVLVGNLLTVSAAELWQALPLYAAVAAALGLASSRGWLQRGGVTGWLADLGFYAAFGLVVTSSVAIAGVLPVFAFLIVPALIGLLCAARTGRQLATGTAAGAAAAAVGLAASYALDTSTGATLVCSFALALGLALAARLFFRSRIARRAGLRAAAAAAGAALLASTCWLAAQPRADQPLLDAAEALWPPLRDAYASAAERVASADAEQHARRYAAEAERLAAIEASGLWRGEPMTDEVAGRISSFQQSYHEMIRGERFVMREIRSRGRERLQPVAAALGLLLLSAAAGSVGRFRRAATAGTGTGLPSAAGWKCRVATVRARLAMADRS